MGLESPPRRSQLFASQNRIESELHSAPVSRGSVLAAAGVGDAAVLESAPVQSDVSARRATEGGHAGEGADLLKEITSTMAHFVTVVRFICTTAGRMRDIM